MIAVTVVVAAVVVIDDDEVVVDAEKNSNRINSAQFVQQRISNGLGLICRSNNCTCNC